MKRRFTVGLVLAVLFTLVNIGGGVYAGVMGEARHAGLHVVLAAIGLYLTSVLVARRRLDGAPPLSAAGTAPPELSSRLTHLEQSLDAIAVEVERVGEGQRFMARLFSERREKEPKQE
ncbi:MAG TPA: hypothetical protein VFY85_15000 [Gemmatimonadaceae bacterium]|nr:hypothetical protein [Gemmatimonadaceae bacterium]